MTMLERFEDRKYSDNAKHTKEFCEVLGTSFIFDEEYNRLDCQVEYSEFFQRFLIKLNIHCECKGGGSFVVFSFDDCWEENMIYLKFHGIDGDGIKGIHYFETMTITGGDIEFFGGKANVTDLSFTCSPTEFAHAVKDLLLEAKDNQSYFGFYEQDQNDNVPCEYARWVKTSIDGTVSYETHEVRH
jgi:hypothetical protein